MVKLNEADLDVIANELLGYRSFDKSSAPSLNAGKALDGDRAALRKLVKAAARIARDKAERE